MLLLHKEPSTREYKRGEAGVSIYLVFDSLLNNIHKKLCLHIYYASDYYNNDITKKCKHVVILTRQEVSKCYHYQNHT